MASINVKWNYGDKTLCPVCKVEGSGDNQEHLLVCLIIKLKCQKIFEEKNNCKYSDIFCSDIEKQNNVADLLLEAMRAREILLNKN